MGRRGRVRERSDVETGEKVAERRAVGLELRDVGRRAEIEFSAASERIGNW
jgi:hypothetical protein